MRWAALHCRPPILRGLYASQIRADHAKKLSVDERATARYFQVSPSCALKLMQRVARLESTRPGRVRRPPAITTP